MRGRISQSEIASMRLKNSHDPDRTVATGDSVSAISEVSEIRTCSRAHVPCMYVSVSLTGAWWHMGNIQFSLTSLTALTNVPTGNYLRDRLKAGPKLSRSLRAHQRPGQCLSLRLCLWGRDMRSRLGRMWGRSFRVGASELVLEEGPGISQTFRPERQFWGVLRHVPCDRIWPEAIPRGFRLARRFDGRLSCHGPSPLRLVYQGRLRAVVGFTHKTGKRDIDSVFFREVGHRSTPHKRVGNCYRKVVRDRVFFRSCAQHANQFRYRQTHG
jgi:hypothetical protein